MELVSAIVCGWMLLGTYLVSDKELRPHTQVTNWYKLILVFHVVFISGIALQSYSLYLSSSPRLCFLLEMASALYLNLYLMLFYN